MQLPPSVLAYLQALESHGFACYAVGGCVRDHLLGLTPHDFDLCTAATPEQMKQVFSHHRLVLAGEKHGTVGIVTDSGVVEITTFRTEGGYRDNRHPDWVEFVEDIRGDLARRDFTVNAMAYSPSRGLCDPFGGQKDLENRVLRAVGDADARFREDSLRILRGVRFAVRYGLTPDSATESAMFRLAPLMENLARERIFDELCKLLPLLTARDLQRFAPVLTAVIPELAPMLGFQQHTPHHAYDIYTHTAYVVENVPGELALRWAALLHDVGKVSTFSLDEAGCGHFYGHAQESAKMADAILLLLKAPTQLRQQVVFLIDKHMVLLQPERKTLRRQLSRWGQDALAQLLILQKADNASKGVTEAAPPFAAIEAILAELVAEKACLTLRELAVNGNDLLALGFSGKAIGSTLNTLLSQVLDEQLPNEKQALLTAAKSCITPQ